MDFGEEDTADQTSVEYAIKRSLLSKSKLAIIITGQNGRTQYCCAQCPIRCEEKKKLEQHLLVHYKEYKFLCGICGTGLKRKEHLDRHTLEHQELRPHVCPECGKAFKRKEHLNIHQSVHSPAKTFLCSLCRKSFHRKDHLAKHLQTHNKLFLEHNLQSLSEHDMLALKQEVMDYDENPMVEDDSDLIIDEEDGEHQDYQEDTDASELYESKFDISPRVINPERPFACPLCDKTYKRKDHLKLHSWSHMKKDKFCSVCGKAFHRAEQLLLHMNTHLKPFDVGDETIDGEGNGLQFQSIKNHPVQAVRSNKESLREYESRPHECQICHRRFKRKQHLAAHGTVHSKNGVHTSNSIWCSLCIQGFNTNEEFEDHDCMKNAESETNCQQRRTPQQARKENEHPVEFVQVDMGHSETAHFAVSREERNIPVPRRVFVCKYCSKPFKRKDHYKIHLHIHTGVKSFFCPDCGKGFYRKDHMQKHLQVHSKGKTVHKTMPDLFPIRMLATDKDVKPEITIHAPSNAKLRVPLQIKVPYQMVIDTEDGERCVTIDPQAEEDEMSS